VFELVNMTQDPNSQNINSNVQQLRTFFAKGLSVLTLAGICLTGQAGHAMAIDWSGLYRFEAVELDRTSLASPGLRKSYLLNYLSLQPKIIAADGINVSAKLNILNNSFYPNSEVGQAFGSGSNTNARTAGTNPPSNGSQDSSVVNGRQQNSYLQVSQLYLTLNQEYGAILVGRAPIHFGLGMTYNAGNGAFDHWSDTRDLLAYKFVIGNLSITPMIDKVYDYSLAQGQEVQDVIWNIEYNNTETESIFGLWHQTRSSSQASNDAPTVGYGGTGSTLSGGWSVQDVNLFLARGFESVKFRLEAGFRSGTTGVSTSTGDTVKLNGYGIALEMDFPKPESRAMWQIRTGVASGDNPETTNFEGFHMNRNYDLAFLMMNHPMGQYDLFRTNLQRNRNPNCVPSTTTPCQPNGTDEVVDEETVSNVYYFSPRYRYAVSDKWDFTGTLTYAQLQTNPIANDNSVAKDVGYEFDAGWTYKPTDRIQWLNEIGLFMPGGAFKGGTNNYTSGFTYGVQSKAAISF
jgi:hypothetical protein